MGNSNRLFVAAVCAIVAMPSGGIGQIADAPRVWAAYYPRGQAASDPIVKRMINYNAAYPSINWRTAPPTNNPAQYPPDWWSPSLTNAAPNPQLPLPTLAADRRALIGKRIALEALRRGSFRSTFTNSTDPDLALFLGWVGVPVASVRTVTNAPTGGGNLPVPKNPGGGSTPGGTNQIESPDLYAHPQDLILVERTRFPLFDECADPLENRRFAWFRTPWMNSGINVTREWMTSVVTQYNGYQNINPQVGPVTDVGGEAFPSDFAAYPARVVFDQEPALILHSAPASNRWPGCGLPDRKMNDDEASISWSDTLDYWAAL